MRCTSPRTVGFQSDGKTICWSSKSYSKEYPTFQLPCGKCIECRLEYARNWAVRCVHEAQMHEHSSFITLTYSDENLKSPKLDYSDFQKFMKKLRKTQDTPIGVFVTGEYGEKTKRPHWHAILFGYRPPDARYLRKNDRGDVIYSSKTLDRIWGLNDSEKRPNEIGSVTFQSAGYCARYATKKLVHGNDDEHDFKPISKKSSKHAIGKKWLERFWPDVFTHGHVVLPDGSLGSIPRYYEKWLKENQPAAWLHYVTETKFKKILSAQARSDAEHNSWTEQQHQRLDSGKVTFSLTERQRREKIIKQKLLQLHQHLKL